MQLNHIQQTSNQSEQTKRRYKKITQADLIGKTAGRWTRQEHLKFIQAIKLFGKNWKKIEDYIGTRTGAQIRSHSQKYFMRIQKMLEENTKNNTNNTENQQNQQISTTNNADKISDFSTCEKVTNKNEEQKSKVILPIQQRDRFYSEQGEVVQQPIKKVKVQQDINIESNQKTLEPQNLQENQSQEQQIQNFDEIILEKHKLMNELRLSDQQLFNETKIYMQTQNEIIQEIQQQLKLIYMKRINHLLIRNQDIDKSQNDLILFESLTKNQLINTIQCKLNQYTQKTNQ